MTTWDTTVDFVIAVGRRRHGRRPGRRRRRGRGARPREAGPDRRVDLHVRRHRLDPEQPADAGRGRRRLLRGRHGPLRDRGRRRRAVLVVRAPPRLPHRRPRDDRRSSSGSASRFVTCPGYSDYYSNRKGGHDVGRGIEPVPWNGRKLGPWLAEAAARAGPEPRPGRDDQRGPVAVELQPQRPQPSRSRPGWRCAPLPAKARRQALLTNGASLIGQMLAIAVDRGIPVWTEAPLEDLIVEDGRVVGVRTVRDGAPGARSGPARAC